ncbi:MAG: hypothetical protein IT388_10495 [Nitrospirales bacterium]|nr:hypothetical protein [Nitrospirales bacterium]
MLKTAQKTLTGTALRDAGWHALVKSMGLVNATRFILQYESGYGDYTEIKKELFKGKKVADICREIDNKP